MQRTFVFFIAGLSLFCGNLAAQSPSALPVSPPVLSSGDYAMRPEVAAWIADFATRSGIEVEKITEALLDAKKSDAVIELMDAPVKAPPPWYEYAPRFLNAARIHQGTAFHQSHQKTLARAERYFGVPSEIITAIIGIETHYGKQTGRFRVIDALATLSFDYPRRAAYFTSELESLFLLARDLDTSPLTFKGSYAGAMGFPQFMPNSYRKFAVDFDEDHKVDLWNATDAIGSVAYYLKEHGWITGTPIMENAIVSHEILTGLGDIDFTEFKAWHEWQALGITLPSSATPPAPDMKVALFSLATAENKIQYFLAYPNFQAILKYNKSKRYAAAVTLLAAEIRAKNPAPKPAPKKTKPSKRVKKTQK